MKLIKKEDFKICIVGLGYVGLPLAARFSLKGFNIIGYDLNSKRVQELQSQIDRNNDISKRNLKILLKNSKLTTHIDDISDCNIFMNK